MGMGIVTEREWEWEGMGIDCMGMEGKWECKKHIPAHLYCSDLQTVNVL